MRTYEKCVAELDKKKIRIRLAELDMRVSDWARKAGIEPRVLHTMLNHGRPWSPNWERAAAALGWRLEELGTIRTPGQDEPQQTTE